MAIEARGKKVICQYFDRNSIKHKGITDKYDQKHNGDYVIDSRYYIEVKTDTTTCVNFFIETWSNLNKNRGWIYHLTYTDYLYYYFLNKGELYIVDYQALRWWFFKERRYRQYREAEQKTNEQLNKAWGRLVPIKVIGKEVGVVKISGLWETVGA